MPDREVPSRELRNNYAALLREVADGSEITILRDGVQIARLIPADRPTRRRFLPPYEMLRLLSDNWIDYDAFMADVRPPDRDTVDDIDRRLGDH